MAEPQAAVAPIAPELTPLEERVLCYFCWIENPDNIELTLRMIGLSRDEWKAAVDRLLELGFVGASAAATLQ